MNLNHFANPSNPTRTLTFTNGGPQAAAVQFGRGEDLGLVEAFNGDVFVRLVDAAKAGQEFHNSRGETLSGAAVLELVDGATQVSLCTV